MQFANYHALNKKIKSNGQGQLKEDKEELCEFIDRYEKEGGDKRKRNKN